jgi:hypothetical protein
LLSARIKCFASAASLLLLLAPPLSGVASSPATQTATFRPAPASEPFEQTLQGCVNRAPTRDVHLLSGLGGASYPLVTLGPAAEQVKAFYSQGVTLQYGFNFPAAIHAFYRAATLDEGASMPYWGIALSASSNINSQATQGCNRLAYRATQLALQHAAQRQGDSAARATYTPAQLQREVDYARVSKVH